MVAAVGSYPEIFRVKEAEKPSEEVKFSEALPNESKVMWVARKILDVLGLAFQAVAAFAFVIAGSVVALPVFIVSETAFFLSKLGIKDYTIGKSSEILDEKMLNEHLQILKNSKKKFSKLEIVSKEGENFEISKDTAKLLGTVHPEHIVLKNCQMIPELVDDTSTETYYYQITRTDNQIDLKRKHRLLKKELSADKDEMLKELKELADKKQKVTTLKLNGPIPPEAQEYLNVIQPVYYLTKAVSPDNVVIPQMG